MKVGRDWTRGDGMEARYVEMRSVEQEQVQMMGLPGQSCL